MTDTTTPPSAIDLKVGDLVRLKGDHRNLVVQEVYEDNSAYVVWFDYTSRVHSYCFNIAMLEKVDEEAERLQAAADAERF